MPPPMHSIATMKEATDLTHDMAADRTEPTTAELEVATLKIIHSAGTCGLLGSQDAATMVREAITEHFPNDLAHLIRVASLQHITAQPSYTAVGMLAMTMVRRAAEDLAENDYRAD